MATVRRQLGRARWLGPCVCSLLTSLPLCLPLAVDATTSGSSAAARPGGFTSRAVAGRAVARRSMSGPASITWQLPLDGRADVARRFEGPAAPWAPGHRGVDLRGEVGQTVLSPADGVVTFAGVVAGRSVMVLTHAAGLRTSLEPVQAIAGVGTRVRAHDPVGRLTGESSHCTPVCLHWGVRRGSTYLDPLALLGGRAAVLLPIAGQVR